jgi:hypothetical protein
VAPPTLSELIRRLERELGAPVLTAELPDGWRTLPDHLRHRGER